MTQQIAYLEAVVGADITSFRRGMQEVRRETGLLSDTMGGISHLGRNMTLAITAPLLAGAGAAIKLAGSFDASMRNINSIAFLSEDALKKLSDRTLEFGQSIRSGPQAASEALYTVFSAGITDTDKAFMVMQIGAKTAEAGLADLTATTEGLTAAALTFGDQSEKALLNFSDAATLAVQLGVGSMDTFNTGMANVIGTGAALGDTYQDLAATTAFLSQRGIDFASAGTYLNNALSKMIKPSEELDALFHKMGYKSGKELLTTTGSFTNALREMYKVVGSDETVWSKLFPDARGFKAVSRIFTMFEEDGTDAVSEFFDTFNNKMEQGGVTSAAWEQQMMSFSAQFDKLTSALQGFAIAIGEVLLPVITPIVNKFTEFITTLSQSSPEVLQLGVAFAALVAAAGPLLWLIGSLVTPFGVLIGLIGALAVAVSTNFGGIRDTIQSFLDDVVGGQQWQDLTDGIQTFIKTLFPAEPVVTGDKIFGPAEDFKNYADAAGKNAAGAFTAAIDTETSAWDLFTSSGLDDKMSWTAFQDELKKQGWTGGALTAGMNFTFFDVPTMQTQFQNEIGQITGGNSQADQMQKGLDYINNLGKPAPDNSFGGRLSAAITAAWPKVKEALDGMWVNFQSWVTESLPAVDEWGAGVLDQVAGWFGGTKNTQGKSPVYDALHSLLSGDIGKAAGEIGNWFSENFPSISKGLQTLGTNIGNWFMNDAVPTVARSIGYFAGRISVLVGQAISGIWTSLTSGATGQGVNQAGKAINDSVLSPMAQGFQQAQKEAGLTNPVDQFFTDLASLLLAGAVAFALLPGTTTAIAGTVASMVSGLAASPLILNAVNALWGLIFGSQTLQTIALGGGQFTTGMVASGFVPFLTKLFAPIITTVGPVLATFTGAVSAAWASFMGLVSAGWTATTGFIVKAATMLWTGFTGALTALMASPIAMGIVLGSLLYMVIPDSWKTAIHDALGGLIDKALGGSGDPDSFDKKFENRAYEIIGAFMVALGDERGYAIAGQSTDLTAKAQAFVDAQGPAQVTWQIMPVYTVPDSAQPMGTPGYKPALKDDTEFWKTLGIDPNAPPSVLIPMPTMQIDPATITTGGTLIAGSMDEVIAKGITPETFTQTSSAIQTGIATAMQNGDYDGQAIVDTLITPLADGFVTNFGETSPAVLAWTNFMNGIINGEATTTEKFTLISEDMTLLATDAEVNMPRVTAAVLGALNPITKSLHDADFAAKQLSTTLSALNGSTVTLTTTVVGGTPPDISNHASGGTMSGMSIVGERGPELVNMGANKGTVMPTRILRDAMNGANNSPSQGATINIYGVTTLDDIIYEAERRGIPIVRN